MPAQLDPPGPSTQPCAGDQRAGLCFGLSFPPPFFILPPPPVLFVSLTLWVGIAATCWLSDSRADCPLTVPSPSRKVGGEAPPYALTSCFGVSGRLWPFSKSFSLQWRGKS